MAEFFHLDFASAIRKFHFVHQLPNQIDAAAVVGSEVVFVQRIGNFVRIETWAGIANDDANGAIGGAIDGAAYNFCDVSLAAMDDGIGDSFAKRSADGETLVAVIAHGANALQNLIFDYSNSVYIGRN